jgi:hypothetical protein
VIWLARGSNTQEPVCNHFIVGRFSILSLGRSTDSPADTRKNQRVKCMKDNGMWG